MSIDLPEQISEPFGKGFCLLGVALTPFLIFFSERRSKIGLNLTLRIMQTASIHPGLAEPTLGSFTLRQSILAVRRNCIPCQCPDLRQSVGLVHPVGGNCLDDVIQFITQISRRFQFAIGGHCQ